MFSYNDATDDENRPCIHPMYLCRYCEKKFTTTGKLRRHQIFNAACRDPNINRASSQDEIRWGFARHGSNPQVRIVQFGSTSDDQGRSPASRCNLCNIDFANWRALLQHRQTVHNKSDPARFECHVCAQKFDMEQLLERHALEEHLDEDEEALATARNRTRISVSEAASAAAAATQRLTKAFSTPL